MGLHELESHRILNFNDQIQVTVDLLFEKARFWIGDRSFNYARECIDIAFILMRSRVELIKLERDILGVVEIRSDALS